MASKYRLALVLGLLAACGDGDGTGRSSEVDATPDAEMLGGPEAVFVVSEPGEPVTWGTVPWPSDLYLDGAGRIAVTALPVGREAQPGAVAGLGQALARMDGAGVTTNLYFSVLGAVDPATLPGNVKLLDLDGEGTPAIPLDVVFRADLGLIIASPPLGTVLAPGHRHGAFVTRAVRDPGGLPLRPSNDLRAILSGEPIGAPLERARASLAPLLDVLPEQTLGEVAAVTVFRTGGLGLAGETRVIRDLVHASPPTLAGIDAVYGPEENELDALLGDAIPGQGPGIHWDQPSAVTHEDLVAVVHGRITLPSFLGTRDGEPGLIAAGAPAVKGHITVPFTLTIPRRPTLAKLPVVVFVHGIGSTRSRAVITANTLADFGMATLAIDLPFHGSRALNPVDAVNEYTGAAVADGYGDNAGIAALIDFFHISERGGFAAHHPAVIVDHFRQSTAEIMALGAFVQDGDPALLRAALAEAGLPDDLSFDDDVAVLGYSFGSFFASVAVAVDPAFDAAVLGVPPAGFPYPTLLHSHYYGEQFNAVLLGVYDVADRVQLGDAIRDPRFDPALDLLGQVVEVGEGIGYARGVARGVERGGSVPSVLLLEAWNDESVPNSGSEHLAGALGATHVTLDTGLPAPDGGLVRYVQLPEQPGPFAGNVDGGRATIALTAWHPAGHGLFLSLVDAWTQAPGLPPFIPLPQPVLLDNPVALAQVQVATFLADAFLGQWAPRVIDPYRPAEPRLQ